MQPLQKRSRLLGAGLSFRQARLAERQASAEEAAAKAKQQLDEERAKLEALRAELYQKIGRLEMELEWLKKKVGSES